MLRVGKTNIVTRGGRCFDRLGEHLNRAAAVTSLVQRCRERAEQISFQASVDLTPGTQGPGC